MTQYVKGLSSAEFHVQVTLLAIFICYLLYKSYKTYHQYRFISDTATSKIASAAQGYVELTGLGELMEGSLISSPFSQRRCLWYQCILEKRNSGQKHNYWMEESNQISDELFRLVDDSGECIIIPDGAHVIPSIERVWYANSNRFNTAQNSTGWTAHLIGFGSYRFTERLITVAEPLLVMGLFKSIEKNTTPDSLNDRVNALLQRWKKNPEKYLRQFDRDKNGKIQRAEWTLIRKQAITNIRHQQQETFLHTLQNPNEKNQPFLISSLPESVLILRKQRYIALYFMLFLFLLVILLTAIDAY
ncbi:MAG: hypothetical protein H8E21_16020 [Gammaproteobacteria bacterium]|nr:hypothetical protein [Gammaproteobacteria bacterium]